MFELANIETPGQRDSLQVRALAQPRGGQLRARRSGNPDSTEGFLVSGNLALVPGRLSPESEARRVEWGWDGPLAL
jgi:hypothetical protein